MYAEPMENKWVVEKWKYYHLPWAAFFRTSGGIRHEAVFATWQEAFDWAMNEVL